MAYYGYMHMSTIYVKKGDVLNGKERVGYISDNGMFATGKHLHVQKQASNDKGNWADTFASDSDSLDPTSDFKKYGEPSPNDITCGYHSTPYPYNSSGMHQGVDYSGVIDKDYEEPYAYSLARAKMKVIDIIYNDKYFGNFVVLQIIGDYEEEKVNFGRSRGTQGKIDINYNNDATGRYYYDSLKKGTKPKECGILKNQTLFFNGIYKHEDTGWVDHKGRARDYVRISKDTNIQFDYYMPIYEGVDVIYYLTYEYKKGYEKE